MRYIFISAITALFATSVYAVDDWTTYYKSDQLEIRYQYADCHDEANGIHQQKVLLQFVNLGVDKKEVSFSKELIYGGTTPVSSDVKNYTLTLQPFETIEGLCSDKNRALFIFSKHLNFKSRELKKFELKNISVKTIQ